MDYTFSIKTQRKHTKKLKGLFCSTCEIEFQDARSHQAHYKSELHKYNLKRRIVDLPPISLEFFEKKKQGTRGPESREITREIKERRQRLRATDLFKREEHYCQVCSKPFKSKNKFEEHRRSKKHMKRQKQLSKGPARSPKVPIPAIAEDDLHGRCLFCHFRGNSFEEVLEHSRVQHSFFFLGTRGHTRNQRLRKLPSQAGALRAVPGTHSVHREEMHILR